MHITKLPPGWVFVFGSNLAGRHGAGAAFDALIYFGAKMGEGWGRTGMSYAIPTKDRALHTLPLGMIKKYVGGFLEYSETNPKLHFFVTPIGCGLAGYSPNEIAPMFADAPGNVTLPKEFLSVLGLA